MRLSLLDDSSELRVRVDGGRVQFTIAMALFALGLMLLVLSWHGNSNRPIASVLIGAGFTALGAIFASYSSGFVVDRRLRSIAVWSNLLGYRKTRQYDLGRCDTIRLVPYWNRSRHGPERLYRILLCSKADHNEPLELEGGLVEARAREHLARIAELTGLPTVEAPFARP